MLEIIDAMVMVLDLEGRIQLFNRRCRELFGYRESEVIGRTIWDFLVAERNRTEVKNYYTELRSGQFTSSFTGFFVSRNGQEILVHWQNVVVTDDAGTPSSIVATGQDVTESVARNAEQTRLLLSISDHPLPIIQLDDHGMVIYANRAALQACNRRRLQGENWLQICPELSETEYRKLLSHSVPQIFSLKTKIGRRVLQFDHHSVPDRKLVLVFGQDLTPIIEAEEKAHQVDSAARLVFEAFPIAAIIVSARGIILGVNAAAESFFGYRRSELLGKHIGRLRIFHGRSASEVLRPPGAKGVISGEIDVVRKGAQRVVARLIRAPVKRDEQTDFLFVFQDASELKQVSNELAQLRDKLQLLTQAHAEALAQVDQSPLGDLYELVDRVIGWVERRQRQAVSVLRNATRIIASVAPPEVELSQRRSLQSGRQLQGTTYALDQITAQLRVFHERLGQLRMQQTITRVDLLVKEALEQVSVKAPVRLVLDFPTRLPMIKVDRGQIARLIENIVRNGLEAMPDGGTMLIRATSDGKTLLLTISDSGKGMKPETARLVFRPFFTTKTGTIGMGLLRAREVVEANSGKIDFESEPGQGTIFRIFFPVLGPDEKVSMTDTTG